MNLEIKGLIPLEIGRKYDGCIRHLADAGITVWLPKSNRIGVIGADGQEFPLPTKEEVLTLFEHNCPLVETKSKQGFNRLQLVPIAIPTRQLLDLAKEAILKYQANGNIYQTRMSESDPLIPVRVNKTNQIWIWETLRKALEEDALVYFPTAYSSANHHGMTKIDAITSPSICAVPGWSVGLAEGFPLMPSLGQGETIGGRKQLEVGLSPCEYLERLKSEHYHGETGLLLEDFLTTFLTHLQRTSEISHDVDDHNAIWCLGHYLRLSYADVVPTGRWIRQVGRLRLDMHRSRNKECTQSWGAKTVVRLKGLD